VKSNEAEPSNDPDACQFQINDSVDDALTVSRRIILSGEINDSMSAYVTIQLQFFAKQPKLPVFMYINSPGGSLYSGYAIIDQMNLARFPVFTIVRGEAISMAAIIAAYGTPGCRFMTQHSCMMIHPVSLETAREGINRHKDLVDYIHKDYLKKLRALSKRLNIDNKTLMTLTKDTCWMTPKQAIKIGMIDGIWTKGHEAEVDALRKSN